MKLPVPFIQLPLQFDAAALAAEVAAFDESLWQPHPNGIPGNSALPLITVEGDPARGDALQGPMRPTPVLQRSPYFLKVLGSLNAVLGRCRLMRLSGHAEVDLHVDSDYYWHERVRVHVPILTQPTVRFTAGDHTINMAAGECWIFDTWLLHHVLNDQDHARIHLVADTVGGAAFWDLVNQGRPHTAPRDGWAPRRIEPGGDAPPLMFESVNSQSPMSYWELRDLVQFILNEAQPQPRMAQVADLCGVFVRNWQTLWFRHGSAAEGMDEYAAHLGGFLGRLAQVGHGLTLRNGADLVAAMSGILRRAARPADAHAELGEERARQQPSRPTTAVIERPVFIVSPPRSGSSLLFETLAQAPGLYTIGGESHGLIEGLAALDTRQRGYESNRLTAEDASPLIAEQLRARFRAAAFDRERKPPGAAFRLLEKTPKNALRVPFLNRIFPDALFVYLYRDPRQVLASMLEAWESGGFRTYRELPGWNGPPWSLLLTPGWRELNGAALGDIVATQWQTTTELLLDDLEALPRERVAVARYDALLADPQAEVMRLCGFAGLHWDRPLGQVLPIANHTVSNPHADKWRLREHVIAPLLPRLQATLERATAFAQR